VNSAIYPEEVEHLTTRYGAPRRICAEIESDPEFLRSFQHSLRRRRAEVAFVIRRQGGRILVTTKTFYPAGTFRIPTGGVKPGEAVEEALWRELAEETGLQTTGEARFAALIEYRLTSPMRVVRFATYLFILNAPDGDPQCTDPDEEICEYRELLPCELAGLAKTLKSLGPSWKSWGLWRAVPHELAAGLIAGCEE